MTAGYFNQQSVSLTAVASDACCWLLELGKISCIPWSENRPRREVPQWGVTLPLAGGFIQVRHGVNTPYRQYNYFCYTFCQNSKLQSAFVSQNLA